MKTFLRDTAGSLSLEFGLCCPILVALFFGSVEVTQYVRAAMKFENATRTIANLVAESPSVGGNLADICTAAKLVLQPFAGSDFTATIISVTDDAKTKVTGVDWQDTSCGGAAIGNATSLAAGLVPRPGDSVIIVQAAYAYKPLWQVVLTTGNFTLTDVAYARPRNNQPITKG